MKIVYQICQNGSFRLKSLGKRDHRDPKQKNFDTRAVENYVNVSIRGSSETISRWEKYDKDKSGEVRKQILNDFISVLFL